mmetsp:Transcript_8997/g.8367  ORF Transcript_8997/g.8367 Transcript_8997/m.8367 type:complete len:106 (-) Transcript_8997:1587-1904(-)
MFEVKYAQIVHLLKLLEYIGHYDKFQKGALASYYANNIDKLQATKYLQEYVVWKGLALDKKKEKEAEAQRKQLQQIEDNYCYEKLITLRKFGIKMFDTDQEKKKD